METNITKNIDYNERQQLRDAGIISLAGEIFDGVHETLTEDMEILAKNEVKTIRLIIGSEGGEVYAGLAIIRAIQKARSRGIKVVGDVHGFALSIAFVILQCCDERIMGKGDILMCHGGSAITVGDLKNLAAEQKLMVKLQDDFANLIANRSTSTDSSFKEPGYWHAVLEDGTPQFYDSNEALVMGLIDKVEE